MDKQLQEVNDRAYVIHAPTTPLPFHKGPMIPFTFCLLLAVVVGYLANDLTTFSSHVGVPRESPTIVAQAPNPATPSIATLTPTVAGVAYPSRPAVTATAGPSGLPIEATRTATAYPSPTPEPWQLLPRCDEPRVQEGDLCALVAITPTFTPTPTPIPTTGCPVFVSHSPETIDPLICYKGLPAAPTSDTIPTMASSS